jgi:hypothetical protein
MIDQAGGPGVRGTILLVDLNDGTCIAAPFGYDLSTRDAVGSMLAETADHMVNLWAALGLRLDLVINGKTMPVHPVYEIGAAMDNGSDRNIVSGFLQALETRVTALESDAQTALAAGEQELARLKTAFAAELTALAAEIIKAFQDL